ncbi:uncharacterized protein [Typha latifolia]|uniref:uncharacterized protein n=1 Tax=Typha latifolia TaxID=4733 RepID=UPI003C2F5943
MRRKKKSSMDIGDRQHSRRGGGGAGSELFICFTSRPSSSSSTSAAMRAPTSSSSKSLLSPGRSSTPGPPSLSASLSRRLRNSGSVKGGQSPMFPAVVAASGAGGRRKGAAFEAAEPSSPKVTCIGQVRVKSKKKRKQNGAVLRSRSKRVVGGEASFRRNEDWREEEEVGFEKECLRSKNQRWVYQIPVSICEALRGFGSELNCFFPCGGRSFCSSSRAESEEGKVEGKRSTGSCGQVFARWLMAIEESEEGKRGGVVGLVVEERGKGEVGFWEKEEVEELELEKKDEVLVVGEEEKEEGRVSVCIPPKNALLLMRCRSDPVRMAALANRFWGSPTRDVQVEEEEEEDDSQEKEQVASIPEGERYVYVGGIKVEVDPKDSEAEKSTQDAILTAAVEEIRDQVEEKMESNVEKKGEEEQEVVKDGSLDDPTKTERNLLKEESEEEAEKTQLQEKAAESVELKNGDKEEEEEIKGRRPSTSSSSSTREERKFRRSSSSSSSRKEKRRHSFSTEIEARRPSFSNEKEARRASFSISKEGRRRWSFSIEQEDLITESKLYVESKKSNKSSPEPEQAEEDTNVENPKSPEEAQVAETKVKEETIKTVEEEKKEKKRSGELPDCLLLMMYEPKLSMEVSKETWVCSNDFLRWRPHHGQRPRAQTKDSGEEGGGSESKGGEHTAVTVPTKQDGQPSAPPLPPPTPPKPSAEPPNVLSLEPKTKQYEPFVLTRCKSEPLRSSARLAPDACFWKERHRPIGAAGIGF